MHICILSSYLLLIYGIANAAVSSERQHNDYSFNGLNMISKIMNKRSIVDFPYNYNFYDPPPFVPYDEVNNFRDDPEISLSLPQSPFTRYNPLSNHDNPDIPKYNPYEHPIFIPRSQLLSSWDLTSLEPENNIKNHGWTQLNSNLKMDQNYPTIPKKSDVFEKDQNVEETISEEQQSSDIEQISKETPSIKYYDTSPEDLVDHKKMLKIAELEDPSMALSYETLFNIPTTKDALTIASREINYEKELPSTTTEEEESNFLQYKYQTKNDKATVQKTTENNSNFITTDYTSAEMKSDVSFETKENSTKNESSYTTMPENLTFVTEYKTNADNKSLEKSTPPVNVKVPNLEKENVLLQNLEKEQFKIDFDSIILVKLWKVIDTEPQDCLKHTRTII